MAASSSSDDEIISPSRRKHSLALKRQIIDESDGESDKCNEPQTTNCTSRRSTRIKKRQSREFHMPDKHAYREQIHPAEAVVKPLSPRKLINNLTKVNNRYNAETYESDEDDLSDFIVYDDEIADDDDDDSSSEPEKEKIKNKGRIDRDKTASSASKRQRLREISSSESDTDTLATNGKSISDFVNGKNQNSVISTPTLRIESEEKTKSVQEPETILDEDSDSNDSVLNVSSANKTRKIMSSDSDSDSGDSNDSGGSCEKSATSRIAQQNKHRQELFKDLKEARRKSR